eukprot:474895-Rhodomonas_salina.1
MLTETHTDTPPFMASTTFIYGCKTLTFLHVTGEKRQSKKDYDLQKLMEMFQQYATSLCFMAVIHFVMSGNRPARNPRPYTLHPQC